MEVPPPPGGIRSSLQPPPAGGSGNQVHSGANRYHYNFCQCVSQKHGFLFLEKFWVCYKNVAFELCLTNENFLTFTTLSVIFQILSNFQKIFSGHHWRTPQMALDLKPTLKSCIRIQSNKTLNLSESCSPLICC